MWPEAAGTSCKIFWAHKTLYLSIWELKLHAKMSPPLSRPNFVPNPRFLLIFGQWKTFGAAVSRRRPAGGPTKFCGRSHTTDSTFKHSTIILGWSDDPKGSSQKKLPPTKRPLFGGGVNTFFFGYPCLVLSRERFFAKNSIFTSKLTLILEARARGPYGGYGTLKGCIYPIPILFQMFFLQVPRNSLMKNIILWKIAG